MRPGLVAVRQSASAASAGNRPGERPTAVRTTNRATRSEGTTIRRYDDRPHEEWRHYGDGREDRPYRKKKRLSMLEELFDI